MGEAVLKELRASHYDLILLGTVDRSTDGHLQLGRWVQTMLTQSETPALLLVTHRGTRA